MALPFAPMPDNLPPSEFGGKVGRNRVQPSTDPNGNPGHEPTAAEALMLTYTTGDETGMSDPDDGEAFAGFLPLSEQIKLRQTAGDLPRGTINEEDVKWRPWGFIETTES